MSLYMAVGNERCPRCSGGLVVRLPRYRGSPQWRCNSCGHQWDAATDEERSLIPTHLSGAEAEQFLEEFLAIKAAFEGKVEKSWETRKDAREKLRAVPEQRKRDVLERLSKRWLDELSALQDAVVEKWLVPLARRYRLTSNEKIWMRRALEQCWTPFQSDFEQWFVYVIAGVRVLPDNWNPPTWVRAMSGEPQSEGEAEEGNNSPAAITQRVVFRLGSELCQRLRYRSGQAVEEGFLALRSSTEANAVTAPRMSSGRRRSRSRAALKQDGIIFGAIQAGLKGLQYCRHLDRHNIPVSERWKADGCPDTFAKAYKRGEPWRKKIQDQKHRMTQKFQATPRGQREELIQAATR